MYNKQYTAKDPSFAVYVLRLYGSKQIMSCYKPRPLLFPNRMLANCNNQRCHIFSNSAHNRFIAASLLYEVKVLPGVMTALNRDGHTFSTSF